MSLSCISIAGFPRPLASLNFTSLSLTMLMKKEESPISHETFSLGNSAQGTPTDIRGRRVRKFTIKGSNGRTVNLEESCLYITARETPRPLPQMMQGEVHTTTSRMISPKQLDVKLVSFRANFQFTDIQRLVDQV